MEEVMKEWQFWVTVIQALSTIIGILFAWCIWITLKLFNIQEKAVTNTQTIAQINESLREIKEVLKSLQSEIHLLSLEITKVKR